MKSLIVAACLLLFSTQIVNADIAKPKPPEKTGRYVLHTSLEIVPDPKAYEAKLQITESEMRSLRVGLDEAAGRAPAVLNFYYSPMRTIVAGLLMFLSVSITGVLVARSLGRRQKAVVAAIAVVVMLGAAAIITRGNAGPPGSYRWRGLPQALAEGKATAGGLDIEIIPDDARTGANMRLVIPLKKQSGPGEE